MVSFHHLKKVQEKQTEEEEKQTEEEQTEEKTNPDWVNISKYAFRKIQEDVDEYIKKGWFSKVEGKKVKMIKGIDNKTNRNFDMLNLYDNVRNIFATPNYDKTDDEQSDATDMPELETEESTEQEGQG